MEVVGATTTTEHWNFAKYLISFIDLLGQRAGSLTRTDVEELGHATCCELQRHLSLPVTPLCPFQADSTGPCLDTPPKP